MSERDKLNKEIGFLSLLPNFSMLTFKRKRLEKAGFLRHSKQLSAAPDISDGNFRVSVAF